MTGNVPTLAVSAESANEQPLHACVRAALENYFRDLDGHPPGDLYQMVMIEIERPVLETVMRYTGGNQSRAAAILGLNRGTLRKKLARYGIE
ncbi:DNA-binding transcriptional regulator Fis [Ectothiorhodospiraceae bacterium 2226]|nr:DNA-binding transcriptional regulator Fis [Ectothiorhodospiraceae bacterium 2226]